MAELDRRIARAQRPEELIAVSVPAHPSPHSHVEVKEASVLIIDDVPGHRDYLGMVLEWVGFSEDKMIYAESLQEGESAYKALAENSKAILVVLDVEVKPLGRNESDALANNFIKMRQSRPEVVSVILRVSNTAAALEGVVGDCALEKALIMSGDCNLEPLRRVLQPHFKFPDLLAA